MRARALSMLFAGLLLAVACGGNSKEGALPFPIRSGENGVPIQSDSAFGPGISVEEALTSDLEGPLLVNGWLWRSGKDDLRLCASLRGSQPPRCVEPSLTIKGLDLTPYRLRTEGSTAWSDQAVQLLGTLKGKVLTVSPRTRG